MSSNPPRVISTTNLYTLALFLFTLANMKIVDMYSIHVASIADGIATIKVSVIPVDSQVREEFELSWKVKVGAA